MPHNTSSNSILGRLSTRSSFISPKEIKVTVQLLNDSDSISNEFKRSLPASHILDYICEIRGIQEKDYLGLRYQDSHNHRYWVDLQKPISHIMKHTRHETINLFLRFRFYPVDATHIREPCTRYQLFVQLQRDMIHGRLYCTTPKAIELSALILQAQLGDFDPTLHKDNYVSQYKLYVKQSAAAEEKIAEKHKQLAGMSTEEAETNFLGIACQMETYGFDPYTVKDPKDGSDVYIGTNCKGVIIFHARQKIHNIPWADLVKVDYIAKELHLLMNDSYVRPADANSSGILEKDKKNRFHLKYVCPGGTFAKHLWNHILSQQAFFNEQSAVMIKPKFSKPRIPLLSRGSTFRFPSQRVLREIENFEDLNATVPQTAAEFVRYELPKQAPPPPQPWLDRSKSQSLPRGKKFSPMLPTVTDENLPEEPPQTQTTISDLTQEGHAQKLFGEPSSSGLKELDSSLLNSSKSNVTSFSVHLVKYERSPTVSPVPESSEQESPISNDSPDSSSPLLTSTPLNGRSPGETKTNGKINGVANGEVVEPEPPASSSGRWVNLFFGTFLTLLILIAIIITLFERQDGQDLIESSPFLSSIRHTYYEPARHFALQQYSKYLRR